MHLLGMTIQPSLRHKEFKQPIHQLVLAIESFGMPLNTQCPTRRIEIDGFNHTIAAQCSHACACGNLFHRLVVRAVHRHRVNKQYLMKFRRLHHRHTMHRALACRHAVVNQIASILRRQVLIKRAAKSDVHNLQPAANTQNGDISVCRQTGNTEFEHIANGVHLAQLFHGILAIVRRSHVLTAGEQHAVEPTHHAVEILGCGVGCQHHRDAASAQHRLYILPANRALLATRGRDADKRTRLAHSLHSHAIEFGIKPRHTFAQLGTGSCNRHDCHHCK